MEHSVNGSFSIRLAIILKNDLINTLKLFQLVQLLTSTYNKSASVYYIILLIACSNLYIQVSSCSSQDN